MNRSASRREFLRRLGALSGAGVAAPLLANLAALGSAAAQSAPDYKALVCVFLYGGNDYANTLVAYDAASHGAYQSLRPQLAYARDALAATALAPTMPLPDARQYALAPELGPLLEVFDAGELAVLLNVGALVQPTTKAQYRAGSVRLPPKLFSHNDQQSFWQSLGAEGASTGWGGRLADLLVAGSANPVFSCVNVSSNAVFLTGASAAQYQITSNGPVALSALAAPLYGSDACSQALRGLLMQPRDEPFTGELVRVASRAIGANETLSAALASGPVLQTPFPTGSSLAAQLQMVARMISVAPALGMKRQVFFVSLGGFDNHDGLTTTHPGLLTAVSQALAAFRAATRELGVPGAVTTFTASDFGRTLTGNNDGSDHGWGSHHFVMGGAVAGRRFYGTPPALANDGPDDVGQGRLLPTTSVDQLGATLGRWFGVSDADLLTVFPDLANFDPAARNLGFV
ncbi:MAG: DUF1501 domain-containing protein [Burkholderiaceae bacterium]